MQRKRSAWIPSLNTLLIVLVSLLVVLAAFAILYVIFGIMGRFSQTILLFVLGAILAYVLAPLVDHVQQLVMKRWAAILLVYVSVVVALALVGILLFTPFIQQGQSLIDNLHNPSQDSLQTLKLVELDAKRVHTLLATLQQQVTTQSPKPAETTKVPREIAALQQAVWELKAAKALPPPTTQPLGQVLPKPSPQTAVPPSYLAKIEDPVKRLAIDYRQAITTPRRVDAGLLARSVAESAQAATAASATLQIADSTPILVLRLQGWLDDHGIKIDLHQHFGEAIKQAGNQAASVLNQAVTILLTAGNLLVNTILVLIISIYFLSDGARLIRKGIQQVPAEYRDDASFFVTSLDRVLAGYIRGQLILALLAGVLIGGGAWVLGVPYPVLIGISTAVLTLVPVIGPVILVVPPVVIAVIFSSLTTAIILLVYVLVIMQIVTNVIGPRVVGAAVGIHPLEAMAAALIGFPLAGFLGSFFAVPMVGFFHVILKQVYHHFVSGNVVRPGSEPSDQTQGQSRELAR